MREAQLVSVYVFSEKSVTTCTPAFEYNKKAPKELV